MPLAPHVVFHKGNPGLIMKTPKILLVVVKDLRRALAHILPKSCDKYCGRLSIGWTHLPLPVSKKKFFTQVSHLSMTDLGFMNCRKKGSPFKYLFLLTIWWANPSRSWEKRRSQSRHRIRTKDSANQWHTQPRRERTDCGYQKRGRWCLCMELLGRWRLSLVEHRIVL